MRRRGPPPCADRVQFVKVDGSGTQTAYRVTDVPAVFVRGEPAGPYTDLYGAGVPP